MSCTDHKHAPSCSCCCLSGDDFVRIIVGVVLGVLAVHVLLACPVLFVALPVLALAYCAVKLVLTELWVGMRWTGHYVLGLPAPLDLYAVPIPPRRPLPRWRRYAIVASLVFWSAVIAAVILIGS